MTAKEPVVTGGACVVEGKRDRVPEGLVQRWVEPVVTAGVAGRRVADVDRPEVDPLQASGVAGVALGARRGRRAEREQRDDAYENYE